MEMQMNLPWRWCLVGNVVNSHSYGDSKDILIGTKHFQPGAKVYMAPSNWGDGYEKIVVIGCPRRRKQYIEVIMRSIHIENFRLTKVYSPSILKMMENSKYSWWDNSEHDQKEIQGLIESLNVHRKKALKDSEMDNLPF